MSLILEALKKSEAERRLGQVPGLMTPVQRVTPRRASRAPWLVLVLLLLVAIGVAGWWWTQRDVAAPPASAVTEPAAPSSTAATSSEQHTDAGDTSAPSTRTATSPPAMTAPAPALPAELPSDPDFVSRERESRPVAANTPEPVDATPPAPRPPAATPRPLPTTREPVAAPAPTTAPVPSPSEEVLELLPRLVDLSSSERDALPPLKLTMHVYARDAASRFVILDGQRMGQGERLSPALTLTEIRRDGAVFEFDGRRFLVPRL